MAAPARSLSLTIDPPSPASRPLAERGRMLFVRDVLALLPRKADGVSPSKSARWVEECFAPDAKRKLGRDSYWWEREVESWLDKERAK